MTRSIRRAPAGQRTRLTADEPLAVLDRLQGGIGALGIDLAVSDAVGDLRLGCAYDLTTGHSSTVQPSDGFSTGPHDSRTPVLTARVEGMERIQLDLRQNHVLRRLIVYAYSASDQPLRWGGTLIVTALADTRIELPIGLPESNGVAVLMSVYNLDGELVVRGEMEIITGSVRDACNSYGFDQISWLDGRHPVS